MPDRDQTGTRLPAERRAEALPTTHPLLRHLDLRVAWGVVAAGAFALAGSIVALWFSMRDVMEVGGSCADGGPFVVATPCPDTAWLAPLSIVVGMAGGFLLAMALARIEVTAAAIPLLAWAPFFLALGWNFAEYGLDPPEGVGGGEWLFCAVLFAVIALPGLGVGWWAIHRTQGPRRALLTVLGVAAAAGIVAGLVLYRAVS